MRELETPRLILRGFRETDVDDLFAYASKPEVGPCAGWKPHESKDESMKILRGFVEEGEVLAITERESGRVIGSIGLHKNPRSRAGESVKELGYVLDSAYWGRGLMTEAARRVLQYAFEEERLALVCVCHYPDNRRSRRVIEKCGFIYEGTIRRGSEIYDGTIMDNVWYSMTREEYFAKI